MVMHRLESNPLLYDAVQNLAGARRVSARLAPHVAPFAGTRVLDVGAGTGRYVETVPDPAEYVAVDLDAGKLGRLAARHPRVRTVVGDASRLDLAPKSFDHALCTFLAHHLDDAQLEGLAAGLRAIVRRSVVLVDPLRSRRSRSRLLWSIDRGSHPRSAAELVAAIEPHFAVAHEERFRVHHEYLLCVATPRPDG